MPEFLTRFWQQIVDFWKNLEKSQKVRIYIISAVVIVAVGFGLYWITRTNYVPLANVEDPSKLKEVEAVLNERNIKYKAGPNGSILVDVNSRDEAEFSLAAGGIVKDGIALADTWNMIKMSSTESDKKHLWNNYYKSKLEKQLEMFDNVKDADVDIVIPEASFFDSEEKKEPKAWVRITPKSDGFTEEQVQGIVRVVSASAGGTKPENISVVDNNFNVLNSGMESGAIGSANSKDKIAQRKQSETENNVRKIIPMLSADYDSYSVAANIELNFDTKTEKTNEVIKPTGMDEAVISEHTEKEDAKDTTAGGVPGTTTNPGTTPNYTIQDNGNSSYKKSVEDKNRVFTTKETYEEKSPGTINKENSSITLSFYYGRKITNGNNINDAFINSVKQDISRATGIPVQNISIGKYKLPPVEPEAKPTMSETASKLLNDYGLFAIMVLLIIGLMVAVMPRKKKSEEPVLEPALAEAAASATGPRFIVPDVTADPVPEIELEERSEVKKQIEKFVKQKPDAVAQLLRNWLSDEWD